LPDVLQPGLSVVFCGTAAGGTSAATGCYYAHSSNKFWTVLAEVGLTSRKLKPREYSSLLDFGIGLTDLCKDQSGNDNVIRPLAEHRTMLRSKIESFQPKFLAFTSAEAGKRYFGRSRDLGLQPEKIFATAIYVLPSTSLMADWNWEKTGHHWMDFAQCMKEGIS